MIGKFILRIIYKIAPDRYYSNARKYLSQVVLRTHTIIDLGGGSGQLWKGTKNSFIVVLDFDYNILKLHKDYVEKICGSACLLPLRNKAFKLAIFHDSLHHFLNPFRAIDEARRVTIDKIIIFDYDLSSFIIKILALIERILGYPSSFLKLKELVRYVRKKVLYLRKNKKGSFILEFKAS